MVRVAARTARRRTVSIFSFEISTLKPVFGRGHVLAGKITWFALSRFEKSATIKTRRMEVLKSLGGPQSPKSNDLRFEIDQMGMTREKGN